MVNEVFYTTNKGHHSIFDQFIGSINIINQSVVRCSSKELNDILTDSSSSLQISSLLDRLGLTKNEILGESELELQSQINGTFYRLISNHLLIQDVDLIQITVFKINEFSNFTNYQVLDTLISSISHLLSYENIEDLSEEIENSIRVLGQFMKVDRVYLFELEDDNNYVSNTYEWSNKGIIPFKDQMQHMPRATFPWIDKKLSSGEIVKCYDIENLPEDAYLDKELLRGQDIKSLFVVPLLYNDDYFGFIGFDQVKSYRHWSPETSSVLRLIGEIMLTGIRRLKIKEELVSTINQYEVLVENSPTGIGIHNGDDIVYLNQSGENILDLSSTKEIDEFSLRSLLDDDSTIIDEAGYLILKNQKNSGQTQIRTRSGELKIVEWIAIPFPQYGKASSLVFFRDITQQQMYQNRLIESETKYRDLFETSLDALYVSNPAGELIDWNESFRELFGYTNQELKALDTRELYHDPEDRIGFIELLKIEKELTNLEVRMITKAGESLFCLESSKGIFKNGKLIKIQGIIKDITDLKLATDALVSSEKLNSIAILAGGIAHDINNLLTTITGYTTLLLDMTKDRQSQEMLKELKLSAERAADLTDKLLAYAGKKVKFTSVIDLKNEVISLQDFIRVTVPKNVILTYLLEETGFVDIDRTQFSQILVNLVSNAVEANNNDTINIEIQTGVKNLTRKELKSYDHFTPPSLKYQDYAVVEVKDFGEGINKSEIAKIFEPFYSSKFAGRGLGLSASVGIVKSHNGGILVQTNEGSGSVFTICLPIAKTKPQVKEAEDHSSLENDEFYSNILFIDDQDSILSVANRIMRHYNLNYRLCNNATDALELIANETFDLIIIDQMMPDMEGIDIIKQIRNDRIYSGDIVLTSGFSKLDFEDSFERLEIKSFLSKPFNLESLEKALRKN